MRARGVLVQSIVFLSCSPFATPKSSQESSCKQKLVVVVS